MQLILTGVATTAHEMERLGVVNTAVPIDRNVVDEALIVAQTIASFSAPAIALAMQAVTAGRWKPNANTSCQANSVIAESTTLKAGLDIERALYYNSFSLADFQEGVAAFLEKRPAKVQHQ